MSDDWRRFVLLSVIKVYPVTPTVPKNATQCHPNYTADIREGVAVEYVSCEPSENLKELFPEEYSEDDSFEEEKTEQA